MSPLHPLLLLLLTLTATSSLRFPPTTNLYTQSPHYSNKPHCHVTPTTACSPHAVHVALTLDSAYLRGTIAAVHSLLRHSSCPHSLFLHFLSDPTTTPSLSPAIRSIFPHLNFQIYPFDPIQIRHLISNSTRPALETPLNFARAHLPHLLPTCVSRTIYLDSDVILVDDIITLWNSTANSTSAVSAPEYCHANFTKYFTEKFWAGGGDCVFSRRSRKLCYFNTGVMVMNLGKWRRENYRRRIEEWMAVQKEERIYELGSLPPFLLVFAGEIGAIEHRWNQHGLGGDNLTGECREVHPGPVSLLHWSGKEKPWDRIDQGRACPVDELWRPYDLYRGPVRGVTGTDRWRWYEEVELVNTYMIL